MKFILPVITFYLISFIGFSQTTLYSEDFSSQIDKGVIGPSPYTYDTTSMTWTIDVSSSNLTASTDYFKVNGSEEFESKDVDGEAIWMSPITTISSVVSVDLSADVAETNVANNTEYIRVYYILDGGSETLFETNGDNTNSFTSATATHLGISGSTIQIVIRTSNNAGTKTHTFDNISIIETISNVQDLSELCDASSIDLQWTDPTSPFDEILIVANEGSDISSGVPTGDGSAYTANSTLGSGTSLLGGTVIYKSTGNSVSFTGVTGGNTYYAKAFTRKGTTWSSGSSITIIYNPPTAGDVLITEYARHATISDYSYLELYNTTGTDINLSGAKIIVRNAASVSEIVDLSTDISGSITVPANGFLILNRNRSEANFESTWDVDLSNTGSSVNYNRTGINNFGNDKKFSLQLGGTADTDDGTLIDESTTFAGALGKRVFQLPEGNWDGNLDDADERATPGSFYQYEDITLIQLAYSGGSWQNQTGYAHSEPSSSTGAAAAVVVNGNASFTSGSQLNILGIWPDAGTDITTESITVTTGLYVAHDGSITITSTGSVTCAGEISISKEGYNTSSDYTIWGSPFSSSLRVDSVFTDHNDCDFYVFQASSQGWKHDYTVGETIDCNGNSHTIVSGNIISSPEGTPDGNFDTGRGYFIVGHSNNHYDFIKTSGGSLNNGSITANIYGSSGAVTSGSNDWNLLSNPYPSGLSINSFLTTNSSIITNAVYLYTPGTGITTSSYETFNSTDNQYIASCQGFFVDASTATDGLIGTASFTNSMRSNENNNFRSLNYLSGIYLSVSDSSQMKDKTRIYFNSDCKEGIDSKYDALKMENTKFTFSSKVDDKKLVFNGLPELTTESEIIPLHFVTNEASIYTISIDSLLGELSNKQILLEDRFNKKFHDLKYQDYQFLSQSKEWANRFFIHVIHQKENGNSGSGPISGISDLQTNETKVFTTQNELIISSEDEKLSAVSIMTITGSSIISSSVDAFTFRINTTAFSQGVYVVKFTLTNGESATRKIIIQ